MDTTNVKRALLREQEELQVALGSVGALDHSVTGDWVSTPEEAVETEADDNVVADRIEAATARDGELAVLEMRLGLVTRALEKIDVGNYGDCEVCGAAIETARLEVNPAARTCTTHMNDEAYLTL
jgi:RNA polymerase-binding transcription factor DksA